VGARLDLKLSTHCRGWDYEVEGAGCRRLDLNHPPTAVGGIKSVLSLFTLATGFEPIPPTAVGGFNFGHSRAGESSFSIS